MKVSVTITVDIDPNSWRSTFGPMTNDQVRDDVKQYMKSAQPAAKKALVEIWNVEDKHHARQAVTAFEAAYGAKFPKGVAKITDDVEELLKTCPRARGEHEAQWV